MSAFVLSDKHIDYLVSAAQLYRVIPADLSRVVGQILALENVKSVDYRYGTKDADALEREIADRPFSLTLRLDPVQVIKAADCYAYQSCEHPAWQASEARRYCDAIRSAAISRLPGYDTAAWAID